MAKDLTKRAGPTAPKQASDAKDATSVLKHNLMEDALARVLGKDEDGEKTAPGTPRVILALASHARTNGWDRAQQLQRGLFEAAAGSGLEMKFSFYGPDDAAGVRRCRITRRWINNSDELSGLISRAECNCGCYVHIRATLAQAVREAEERPLRAVIVVADTLHDELNGLDEAAISIIRLRRMGTRVFLMQLSADPITARALQYLERVAGGVYFRFDPKTQEAQFTAMWEAVSVYAAGGVEAVKTTGGQAAALLLQHLKQEPMPTIEERDQVRVESPLTRR
jgi:hypothetical protein